MGGYGTPVSGDREAALARLRPPAITMVILAALGLMSYLAMVVLYLVGAGAGLAGLAGSHGSEDAVAALLGGGVGIAIGIVGALVNGLIIWGGMKMYNGTSLVMAWVATVLTLTSCFSACCCLTIPVGIWGVVILIDQQVATAFSDR